MLSGRFLLILLLLSSLVHAENENFISSLPDLDRNLLFTQYLHQSRKECSAVDKSAYYKTDERLRDIWVLHCVNQMIYLLRIGTDGSGRADVEECTEVCRKSVNSSIED